jgi:hypothetical protein
VKLPPGAGFDLCSLQRFQHTVRKRRRAGAAARKRQDDQGFALRGALPLPPIAEGVARIDLFQRQVDLPGHRLAAG